LRQLFFLLSFVFTVQHLQAQMEFIQNKGQWDSRVEYRGDFSTGSFFLENQGFTVVLHNVDDLKKYPIGYTGTIQIQPLPANPSF
jgi:hypothetical protein